MGEREIMSMAIAGLLGVCMALGIVLQCITSNKKSMELDYESKSAEPKYESVGSGWRYRFLQWVCRKFTIYQKWNHTPILYRILYYSIHPIKFINALALKGINFSYDPDMDAILIHGKYIALDALLELASGARYGKWTQFYCDHNGLISFRETDRRIVRKRQEARRREEEEYGVDIPEAAMDHHLAPNNGWQLNVPHGALWVGGGINQAVGVAPNPQAANNAQHYLAAGNPFGLNA